MKGKETAIVFKQTRMGFLHIYFLAIAIVVFSIYIRSRYETLFYIGVMIAPTILFLLEIYLSTRFLIVQESKVGTRRGLIKISSAWMTYNNVTDILILQSFIGRILDYGSLFLNTAGKEEYGVMFHKLRHPYMIKNYIELRKEEIFRLARKKVKK